MILQAKTLEVLRVLINEKTEYRSGPQLVALFNQLGFHDMYEQGFPSRWAYTDEKLQKINGTPELDKCIKMIFSPINYVKKINELDNFIAELNQYLMFDKLKIIRKNSEILIEKYEQDVVFDSTQNSVQTEDEFLNNNFGNIDFNGLDLEPALVDVLNARINEIRQCIKGNIPLAGIFLCGSVLEGCLLGIASKNPALFNSSSLSPKDKEGKVKKFYEWNLSNLIDAACDVEFLGEDVKKFSHALRDFRNYIHPFQQMSEHFSPDEHTLRISGQVLNAAIYQLKKK